MCELELIIHETFQGNPGYQFIQNGQNIIAIPQQLLAQQPQFQPQQQQQSSPQILPRQSGNCVRRGRSNFKSSVDFTYPFLLTLIVSHFLHIDFN